MTLPTAAAHYATLYAPTSRDLRQQLREIGEALHAQLEELSARPTRDGCDRMAANLAGAQSTVRKLHEALIREGGASDR